MERGFSARDIGSAIIFDLRRIDGAERYLDLTQGGRLLVDRFASKTGKLHTAGSDDYVLSAETLRASLSAKVSGGRECVYAFYNAVLAYDEICREQKPAIIEQNGNVMLLANIIIGNDRTVDMS